MGLVLTFATVCHAGVAYAGQLTVTLETPSRYFSPNGDGQEDTLSAYYKLSGAADVTIAVYTKGGALVRTLQSEVSEAAGGYWLQWDGRDDSSKTVTSGAYHYTVSATSATEGNASATREVGVDTGAPGTITAPSAKATIKGVTTFSFKPTSDESVEYVEFYGNPCYLGTAIDAEPDGSYSESVDVGEACENEGLSGGANEISAYVNYRDPFGQSHWEWTSIPVTVANPETIRLEQDRYFSPNGDGQEDVASIGYWLGSPGKATITIANAANETIKTVASEAAVGYGWNSFQWDGTNQSSQPQPDGEYKYTVTASDGFGSPAVATGRIGIDREAPGTITSPATGATISGTTHLVFKPAGTAVVQSVAFYGRCNNHYDCYLGESDEPEPDGTFRAEADVSELSNGSNAIIAEVYSRDAFGTWHYEWVEIPVRVEAPEIIEVETADHYFGNSEEPSTEVEFVISSPGEVTVAIENEHGETVATPKILSEAEVEELEEQEEGAEVEGELYGYWGYFIWNGKNSHGQPVPEGIYTYTITASDGVGAPASVSGRLGVDRRTPATLTAPTAGSHLAGEVHLEVQMADGDEGLYADFETCQNFQCRLLGSTDEEGQTMSSSVEAGEFFTGANEVSAYVRYQDPLGGEHWYATAPVNVGGEGAAPQNTQAPQIHGAPEQGEELIAGEGKWTESPSSFYYQWLRCNSGGSECTAIEGATESVYVLGSEDVGHTVRLEVVAENTAGRSGTARSLATDVITAPPPVPTNTQLPSITGTAVRGQTLTAGVGSWTNEPSGYRYQWLRCEGNGQNCVSLGGQTGYALTLGNALVGYTIEVRVVASNAGGNSQPAVSAPTSTVTVSTLHAHAGEAVNATVGVPVQLDGSGSTPAEAITGYGWEFGDGTTGSGEFVTHTYTQPGTYTATLKITDGVSSATASTTVTVIAPPAHGLEVTVLDGSSQPINAAEVLYVGPDGKKTAATSGSDGKAVLAGLPDGSDSLYVYKEGFQPAVAQATVSGGAGKTSVKLESGAVATTTLSDKEMTLSEIEAAGIDVNDPANQEVFEFEVRLAFFPSPVEFHCYVNSAGEFVGGCAFAGGGGECSSSECSLGGIGGGGGGGGGSIVVEPEVIEGKPLIEWLILRGSVTVLKQFTTVSLTVQNLADEPFKLSKGKASLTLPEGLSLAPTPTPQSYSQALSDIPGKGSATATWVVRGDTPGMYTMSADYKGQLEPFEAPVDIPAALKEPFHVWGAEAFTLKVKADSGKLEPGQPYHVTIGLTNKADIPFYNVKLAIDPNTHANFIFQPAERFSDSVGELAPGQTLFSHRYILVPDAESVGVFNPALSTAAFDGEEAHPGKEIEEVTPPPLYAISAPGGSSERVHLHWEAVPGAEGYEVFPAANLDTPFHETQIRASATAGGTLSTAPLSAAATDAFVPGTYGVPRYFAVTALVGGHPTLESDVIAASSPGGLGTPAAKAGPAREVTLESATLTATVNPQGEEVEECVFEYGLTAAYGSSVPCATLPGGENSPVAVSAAVSGLQPNSTYHFRVFAGSQLGWGASADETFTTLETSTTGTTTNPAVPAKATDGGLSVQASEGVGRVTIGPYGSDVGGVPLAGAGGAYFQVYRSIGSTFKKMEYSDCELHGTKALWWDNPATGWEPISEPTATYTASPTPCITVKATESTTPSVAQLLDPRHVGGASGKQEYGKCEPAKKGHYSDAGCTAEKFKEKNGTRKYSGKYEWQPAPVTCFAFKHGKYKDPSCTEPDEKKGKGKGGYEAGANTVTASGGHVSLEAAGVPSLSCQESNSTDVQRSPKQGSETITFTGCEQPNATSCSSEGEPDGTIVTGSLETYTYEEGGYYKVLAGMPIMEFTCGHGSYSVSGEMDGTLVMPLNSMGTSSEVKFGGEEALEIVDPQGLAHAATLTTNQTVLDTQPTELRVVK